MSNENYFLNPDEDGNDRKIWEAVERGIQAAVEKTLKGAVIERAKEGFSDSVIRHYKQQRDELLEALEGVLNILPHEKVDYSGVSRCAGCGATLWVSGDDLPLDPCEPNCVLQKAKQAIAKAKGDQ